MTTLGLTPNQALAIGTGEAERLLTALLERIKPTDRVTEDALGHGLASWVLVFLADSSQPGYAAKFRELAESEPMRKRIVELSQWFLAERKKRLAARLPPEPSLPALLDDLNLSSLSELELLLGYIEAVVLQNYVEDPVTEDRKRFSRLRELVEHIRKL